MEVKEYRNFFYVGLSKLDVKGDVRNRYNLPLELLENLSKGVGALLKHVEAK